MTSNEGPHPLSIRNHFENVIKEKLSKTIPAERRKRVKGFSDGIESSLFKS